MRRHLPAIATSCVLTMLVGAPPAAAQAGDVGQAPAATRITTPDIAAILNVALAWFSDEDNAMQTGGHDPRTNGFTLQQLELSLGASVDPYFRLDANLVFSQFGVEVEEAYATTLSLPARLQVRAGQFLTRFGRHNPTHPHSWAFIDQPIVIGKMLGSEGNRGLGAELSWLAPTPWFVEVSGAVTDPQGECCARSFLGADSIGLQSPLDVQATGHLKQYFPFGPDWSLQWGLSAATGPNASGNGNRTLLAGTDLYLRWRPTSGTSGRAVSLQVESIFRSRQVPRDVLQDIGGYSQLVWDLNRRFALGARHDVVSGVRNDTLDPEWSGTRCRMTALATFRPSHFSAIRLQAARAHDRADNTTSWSGMVSLEVVAGAHGAHTY